jgi:hypothetical protein
VLYRMAIDQGRAVAGKIYFLFFIFLVVFGYLVCFATKEKMAGYTICEVCLPLTDRILV